VSDDPVSDEESSDEESSDDSSGGISEAGRPVRILFVCTANRVRSPLAEVVLRAHAERMALPVEARSAGELEDGLPASDEMVWAAKRLGHDLSGHLSTRLTDELVRWPDLIVTMTGMQVVDLVGVAVDLMPRTITLREWAQASDEHPLSDWTPQGVTDWVAPLTQRSINDLLSGQHDVEDPIGRPRRHFRRTAREIHELLAICLRVTESSAAS
jgi:protein-tyrosine phosphatase